MPTARSSPLLVLAALATVGAAGGCTRPAVALKPPAFQQQAEAVRDWQAVATQIATDMQRDGFLPDPARPGAARAVPPYYVSAPLDSQFLQEVAAALRSEILARGGTVAQRQAGAAVIDLTVDIVRWPPRDRAPDGLGTELGLASGTAVVLANQAPLVPAAGFGLLAGAGIMSDLLRTMTPHTNTEIAWGATIALGDRIVFEVRYPMYIGDNDWRLYAAPQPPQIVQLRYAP